MPQFCANLSMLFTDVPFLNRFDRAAAAGFKGVEYLFPYEFAVEDLKGKLDQHGLKQVLHNLPAGDWAAGDRGNAIFADRADEFREGVDRAITYATRLGCDQVNCLSGIAPKGSDPQALRATLADNLRHAADRFRDHGITLLIEPINHYDIPGFFLSTVEMAVDLIGEVGRDNVAVQYDLYHQQRTRGELIGTYQAHKARIRHIQVADNPGRHEPGSGEINYGFVFEALDRAGYAGWIGCEYVPSSKTEDGLRWLRSYVRN